MELTFNLKNSPFTISKKLLDILTTEIQKTGNAPEQPDHFILSFRDENYSAETGGYHPVEIHIVEMQGLWQFDYITDFTYVGCGQDAELVKEIDFDFTTGIGFQLYTGDDDLKFFAELYKLWESNFIDYFESGVFKTEVKTY